MFGGRSPEHDISIITGLQVIQALDPALYDVVPLYIAPDGEWLTGELLTKRSTFIPGPEEKRQLTVVELHVGPTKRPYIFAPAKSLLQKPKIIEFDVAIPCFHGLVGEDGQLQGLFEVANIPYTGMRTMASTILMDKITTKHIVASANVPMLPFKKICRPAQGLLITPSELSAMLGDVKFPCIIKPAHLGSSIGVAKVNSLQELSDTLPAIFRFDTTAILEPFVENLVEYNVSVSRVGGTLRTSAIERPKHSSELLDFKAKYLSGSNKGDGKASGTKSPGQGGSQGMLSLTRDINPDIPAEMANNIRNWAKAVFEQVDGTGAPRLDFLCNKATGEIWFNEANPCPGSFGYFLWEAAEKPMLVPQLLEALIAEAMQAHTNSQLPADPTPESARMFTRKK